MLEKPENIPFNLRQRIPIACKLTLKLCTLSNLNDCSEGLAIGMAHIPSLLSHSFLAYLLKLQQRKKSIKNQLKV